MIFTNYIDFAKIFTIFSPFKFIKDLNVINRR